MRIELYYDCLSPFSFLAFTTLCRYEKLWGFDYVLKPVLLGGIMASTKNLPPGEHKLSSELHLLTQ
jgi:glutathione S-transferase kappa 1